MDTNSSNKENTSPEFLLNENNCAPEQPVLIRNYDDIMGRAWALRVTDNNEEADELLRNAGITKEGVTDSK